MKIKIIYIQIKTVTNEYRKKYRETCKQRGSCYDCGLTNTGNGYRCKNCAKKYRLKYKEKINARGRGYDKKLKLEIIQRYGGKCQCCGLSEFEFLTLDHTLDNGSVDRKQTGTKGGSEFYRIVKKGVFQVNFNCYVGTAIVLKESLVIVLIKTPYGR